MKRAEMLEQQIRDISDQDDKETQAEEHEMEENLSELKKEVEEAVLQFERYKKDEDSLSNSIANAYDDIQKVQSEDRMDARIKELTDADVAYDINEVFGEVNAKTKKQRVVGLGSAASSFCIARSGPTGESSGQSSRQVTEEIQQLKEDLNIKDEEIRRLKAEQESMKEEFNEKLAEVFRRLDRTDEG